MHRWWYNLALVGASTTGVALAALIMVSQSPCDAEFFVFTERADSVRQYTHSSLGLETLRSASFTIILDTIPDSVGTESDVYDKILKKLAMAGVPVANNAPLETNDPVVHFHFQQGAFLDGVQIFELSIEVLQPIATLRSPHYVTFDRTWASPSRVGFFADSSAPKLRDLIDMCIDEFIDAYLKANASEAAYREGATT